MLAGLTQLDFWIKPNIYTPLKESQMCDWNNVQIINESKILEKKC